MKSYYSWRDVDTEKNIKIDFSNNVTIEINEGKHRILMNGLKFPKIHDNKFYRYILCVMFLIVWWTVWSAIYKFGDFYLLKITNNEI